MYDVVALGELLIDFTPAGKSEGGMQLFERNPGGAPANVLCTLAKFGLKTAFIGKVGADMHGEFLKGVLEDNSVDTAGLVKSPDEFTTLAFVNLSSSGERSFSFARKPGADTRLTNEEINGSLLSNCRVFHFGSLSLTDEPARSATLFAIEAAKSAGAIISYDPNYRAPLWRDSAVAAETMRSVLSKVDIIKISDEELGLLTGESTIESAAEKLLCDGAGCVVITKGGDGAYVRNKNGAVTAPGISVPVVDTTGAGDSFWGGFLYKVVTGGVCPNALDTGSLFQYGVFANSVAALCVGGRGAIPALPTLDSALALYNIEILKHTEL